MNRQGMGFWWAALAVVGALVFGLYAGHKTGQALADWKLMGELQGVIDANAEKIVEMGGLIAELQGQVAHAEKLLTQVGTASWYGPGFHGRTAADGSRYDQRSMTAAHRFLPFGTVVRVTSMETRKSIDVRITDRGPFIDGRIIDITERGAELLGMKHRGTHRVIVTPLLGRTGEGDRP